MEDADGAALRFEIRGFGNDLCTIANLSALDTLDSLRKQVSRALAIPLEQLVLCLGERKLDMDSSQQLAHCGISHGAILTAVRVPEPLLYVCATSCEGFATCAWNPATENEARLLLFGGECTLVSKQYHDSDNTFWIIRTLQWDILHGTYELTESADSKVCFAECCWNAHVQRTMRFEADDAGTPSEESDSGWQSMDERASFKWKRISLGENTLPDLDGYSNEEARQFMVAHLKSRGFDSEMDAEVSCWLDPFNDMDEYKELWADEARAFKVQLLQACHGQGLFFPPWLGRESGEAFRFAAALSNQWRRLHLDRKDLEQHGVSGFPPGINFSASRLLGFDICDLSAYVPQDRRFPEVGPGRSLDLVDLPALLGFQTSV